jgi:hypothetical protein
MAEQLSRELFIKFEINSSLRDIEVFNLYAYNIKPTQNPGNKSPDKYDTGCQHSGL